MNEQIVGSVLDLHQVCVDSWPVPLKRQFFA